LELRRIEVAMEMAKKWNGAYPTTYMTFGDKGATPLINIPSSS
jgi:hypothetical protein